MSSKGAIAKGRVAFVFPGQGSQKVGMGREAWERSDAARAVFESADRALAASGETSALSKLCFEGPEDDLKLTRNTQPAVLTSSIALLRALFEGENGAALRPDVVAGHSLGEYTAHVCAGTIEFEDAVRLVRIRGELMQAAVPLGRGAMAAILKMERAPLEAICAATGGIVQPVNYNSPGQIVIAGETAAVEAASAKCKEAGGRVMPLPVSAPFHSSLMEPAEAALAPHLASIAFADPALPVYVNVDAAPVTRGDDARDALRRQVSRPVRWDESVLRMVDDGVTLFVEIGVGNALGGMIKRTTDRAIAISVQKPDDFAAARDAIAQARA
jgi:[acyl-carrier-protein] S-malonyltransferase